MLPIQLDDTWTSLMRSYDADHQHPVNQACHKVGIPLIAGSIPIAATLVGLAVREVIPWWFVWLLGAREVLLAVVMLVLKRAGQTGLPVNVVGKAATLNLLYAFPLLLLGTFDGWVGTAASIVGWAMVWWGVYLYWVAAGLYVVQASRVLGQLRRLRAAGLPDRPAGPGRGAPA